MGLRLAIAAGTSCRLRGRGDRAGDARPSAAIRSACQLCCVCRYCFRRARNRVAAAHTQLMHAYSTFLPEHCPPIADKCLFACRLTNILSCSYLGRLCRLCSVYCNKPVRRAFITDQLCALLRLNRHALVASCHFQGLLRVLLIAQRKQEAWTRGWRLTDCGEVIVVSITITQRAPDNHATVTVRQVL